MTATMTYVGLDVHARSTHAAAIDVSSGELRRGRLGGGSDEVIAWLERLPQPLKGCYEAGPTGFALYRAAAEAGLQLAVVAPSKTPRAPGDRIKHDRKDAELLARLLLAGQLRPIAVPTPAFEAARHLARAREQVRGDLMRARHRVSKLLLLHGRVYDGGAWTKRHRVWLAQQRFDQPASELAYLDALAAVDGLVARKAALDERLWRLAREAEWSADRRQAALLPRHRHADRVRARARDRRLRPLPTTQPARLLAAGWCPRSTSRVTAAARARSPRPAPATRAASWSRPPGTTCIDPASASPSPNAEPAKTTRSSRSPSVQSDDCTTSTSACAHAANPATSPPSPSPASSPASAGPPPWPTNPTTSRLLGRAPGHTLPARATALWATLTGHARS